MRYALPLAFGLLALPATAFAGGFEIGDNGARSLGRGGAYAAGVDEASALYYNPGALTRINGVSLTLNLNLVDYNATFQRAPFIFEERPGNPRSEREIQYDEVSQQTPIFPAPMFFLAHDFGLENWTFAIGAYGPSAFGAASYTPFEQPPEGFEGDICGTYRPCSDSLTTDADESVITREGGQSYMVVDSEGILAYPSIAIARYFEQANLSVGLTLQLATLFVDYTVGVDGDLSQEGQAEGTSQEKFDFYTPNTIDVTGFGFTGILGLLYEPTNYLSFGASYRPQFNLLGKGTIDLGFPEGLSGAGLSLSDDAVELRLSMPDVVRLGVEYSHLDDADQSIFDIELDFVWENWNVLDAFRVQVPGQVSDVTGTLDERNIPNLELGRHYHASWSLRLGTELNMLRKENGDGPVFRLGGFYETPSVDEEWTNLDFTPFERVAGTVGFSYHIKRWSIDLAYAYVWSPDRTVEEGTGQYDVLTPLWVCEDASNASYPAECGDLVNSHRPAHAANEGTYTTWTQTFSLGGTYGW